MKRHLLPLAVIVAIILWLTFAIIRPGWFASHDGIYHIRRVGEMAEMLRAGYFPVRWGLTLDNFFGTPIFNYVYPGPYYLTAVVTLLTPLGTPTALKLLTLTGILLGAIAWYLFYQSRSRIWGITAAILYLTAPYQLVNLWVRFSLGEIMALSLLPWVLLSYQQVTRTRHITWYTPLPLFLTLISHNFIALLGMGVLLVYSYFHFPRSTLILKNTALSLLLASFFLLPMFTERSLVLSGALSDYSFRYSDHFVAPWQLLYSRWDYWYSMPGTNQDGMTFQLGFAQIAIVIISLAVLIFKRSRPLFTLLLLYTITLFLMLPASRWLWDALPLLQVIQFPWRLLGLTILITPLLVGHVKPTLSVALLILILGLLNTRHYRLPRKFWSETEFATEYALIKDKTATSVRGELVPRWAPVERWQNVLVTAPGVDLVVDPTSHQGLIQFTAIATSSAQAVVHKNYFPSWQGRVDQAKLTLAPTPDGAISVALSPGSHTYIVKLGSTKLELLANLLSLLTLFYLFSLKLRHVH